MTLSFYIARRFLTSFFGVFAVFLGILMMIDMVEQIRRFSDASVSLSQIAGLAALNVPGSLYRILPLIMILATIAMFLAMARSSELVVIRASGRSALRLLLTPLTVALLIGAVAVAVLNPLVAATSKYYDTLSSRYARGDESILSISREGLWLRQGGPEGQTVIRAARASLDGTQLFNVTFLTFGPDGTPRSRIEAAEAVLTPGAWALSGGAKSWALDAANPEKDAQTSDRMSIQTDLTQNQIRDGFGSPSSIPIWGLPQFIESLERAGFSARQHRVWFQMELALPLLLASMVLVGAGFTMRHARFGKTGTLVLLAVLSGFALFFLRNFAQILGENGQIPVLMAAWSPPVAAVLMSLGLLLHLEDG